MLAAGVLRLLSTLPYTRLARTGEALGSLLYRLPGRRKRIVHVNLGLCFPEKSASERERLGELVFRQVVRSYLERGVQWYGSAKAGLADRDGKRDRPAGSL